MCTLIGRKPMFYQSIKHTKRVFCCFWPHNLHIVKQMKKPKPCIFTVIKHSGHLRTLICSTCFVHFPWFWCQSECWVSGLYTELVWGIRTFVATSQLGWNSDLMVRVLIQARGGNKYIEALHAKKPEESKKCVSCF